LANVKEIDRKAAHMTKAPQVSFDLFAEETINDPLPGYKLIRDAGPAVDIGGGMFAIGRHADVRAALQNWEEFSSVGAAFGFDADDKAFDGTPIGVLTKMFDRTPPGTDPPVHTRLRKLVLRPLTPVRLKSLRPRVAEVAAALVDDVCDRGSFDAATDLAERLPVSVVAPMIGLPAEDEAKVLLWQRAQFDALNPAKTADAMTALDEATRYLYDPNLMDRVADGSWGAELRNAVRDGEIESDYFAPLMSAYLLASMDTTINAITNMIWLFANNPDQWELLREKPELAPTAVNEAVRLLKGGVIRRRVVKDTSVDGVDIPSGVYAQLMVACANRDERRYAEPERFDITRDNADQLGFGFSRHACAGMNLTRLEMLTLLDALVKRVETWEIVGSVPAPGVLMHGFSSLEVKVA
jgi:cytochrome P450